MKHQRRDAVGRTEPELSHLKTRSQYVLLGLEKASVKANIR